LQPLYPLALGNKCASAHFLAISRTRISCHAARDATAWAPLGKENTCSSPKPLKPTGNPASVVDPGRMGILPGQRPPLLRTPLPSIPPRRIGEALNAALEGLTKTQIRSFLSPGRAALHPLAPRRRRQRCRQGDLLRILRLLRTSAEKKRTLYTLKTSGRTLFWTMPGR